MAIDNFSTPYTNASQPHIEAAPLTIVVLLVLICVWVITANTFVFVCVIASGSTLKSVANIQILSLSATDTLVGVCSIPLVFTYYITGSFPDYTNCAAIFMSYIVSQVATLLHALGICVHRVVSIRRRYNTRRTTMYRPLILQIVLTWMVAIALVALPFILFGKFGQYLPFCSLNTLFGDNYHTAIGFYNAVIGLPMITMNVLYMYIYTYLRSTWKKTDVMQMEMSVVYTNTGRPSESKKINTDRETGEELATHENHEKLVDKWTQTKDVCQRGDIIPNALDNTKVYDVDAIQYKALSPESQVVFRATRYQNKCIKQSNTKKRRHMSWKRRLSVRMPNGINKRLLSKKLLNYKRNAKHLVKRVNYVSDEHYRDRNDLIVEDVISSSGTVEAATNHGVLGSEHSNLIRSGCSTAPLSTIGSNQVVGTAGCKQSPVVFIDTPCIKTLEVTNTKCISIKSRVAVNSDSNGGAEHTVFEGKYKSNNDNNSHSETNLNGPSLTHNNDTISHRGQRRVLVTIGLLLLVLDIFMTPLCLFIVLETLCEDSLSRKIKFILVDIALLNSAFNPVIYGFRIRPFREAVRLNWAKLSKFCYRCATKQDDIAQT